MLSIDGLQAGRVDRKTLEDMRAGDLSAVTVTLGFWEDATATMDNIGRWRDLARENSDLIRLVETPADIELAEEEGRTGVLLGLQNTDALQGRLRFAELFRLMGVLVMQLTYNNQNTFGGSCYEPSDSGLSRFGHELVREMNRIGMLIDLSHVGDRTSREVIEASTTPVAFTHANPTFLYDHKRNKSRGTLEALVARNGVLGLATYPNITGDWADSPERWTEMVERTVEAIGIDHVGIGTDLSPGLDESDYAWMRKGQWTREANYGAGRPGGPVLVPWPGWCNAPSKFPAFEAGLRSRGFSEEDTAKVMGGNFLRLYKEVIGPAGA